MLSLTYSLLSTTTSGGPTLPQKAPGQGSVKVRVMVRVRLGLGLGFAESAGVSLPAGQPSNGA